MRHLILITAVLMLVRSSVGTTGFTRLGLVNDIEFNACSARGGLGVLTIRKTGSAAYDNCFDLCSNGDSGTDLECLAVVPYRYYDTGVPSPSDACWIVTSLASPPSGWATIVSPGAAVVAVQYADELHEFKRPSLYTGSYNYFDNRRALHLLECWRHDGAPAAPYRLAARQVLPVEIEPFQPVTLEIDVQDSSTQNLEESWSAPIGVFVAYQNGLQGVAGLDFGLEGTAPCTLGTSSVQTETCLQAPVSGQSTIKVTLYGGFTNQTATIVVYSKGAALLRHSIIVGAATQQLGSFSSLVPLATNAVFNPMPGYYSYYFKFSSGVSVGPPENCAAACTSWYACDVWKWENATSSGLECTFYRSAVPNTLRESALIASLESFDPIAEGKVGAVGVVPQYHSAFELVGEGLCLAGTDGEGARMLTNTYKFDLYNSYNSLKFCQSLCLDEAFGCVAYSTRIKGAMECFLTTTHSVEQSIPLVPKQIDFLSSRPQLVSALQITSVQSDLNYPAECWRRTDAAGLGTYLQINTTESSAVNGTTETYTEVEVVGTLRYSNDHSAVANSTSAVSLSLFFEQDGSRFMALSSYHYRQVAPACVDGRHCVPSVLPSATGQVRVRVMLYRSLAARNVTFRLSSSDSLPSADITVLVAPFTPSFSFTSFADPISGEEGLCAAVEHLPTRAQQDSATDAVRVVEHYEFDDHSQADNALIVDGISYDNWATEWCEDRAYDPAYNAVGWYTGPSWIDGRQSCLIFYASVSNLTLPSTDVPYSQLRSNLTNSHDSYASVGRLEPVSGASQITHTTSRSELASRCGSDLGCSCMKRTAFTPSPQYLEVDGPAGTITPHESVNFTVNVRAQSDSSLVSTASDDISLTFFDAASGEPLAYQQLDVFWIRPTCVGLPASSSRVSHCMRTIAAQGGQAHFTVSFNPSQAGKTITVEANARAYSYIAPSAGIDVNIGSWSSPSTYTELTTTYEGESKHGICGAGLNEQFGTLGTNYAIGEFTQGGLVPSFYALKWLTISQSDCQNACDLPAYDCVAYSYSDAVSGGGVCLLHSSHELQEALFKDYMPQSSYYLSGRKIAKATVPGDIWTVLHGLGVTPPEYRLSSNAMTDGYHCWRKADSDVPLTDNVLDVSGVPAVAEPYVQYRVRVEMHSRTLGALSAAALGQRLATAPIVMSLHWASNDLAVPPTFFYSLTVTERPTATYASSCSGVTCLYGEEPLVDGALEWNLVFFDNLADLGAINWRVSVGGAVQHSIHSAYDVEPVGAQSVTGSLTVGSLPALVPAQLDFQPSQILGKFNIAGSGFCATGYRNKWVGQAYVLRITQVPDDEQSFREQCVRLARDPSLRIAAVSVSFSQLRCALHQRFDAWWYFGGFASSRWFRSYNVPATMPGLSDTSIRNAFYVTSLIEAAQWTCLVRQDSLLPMQRVITPVEPVPESIAPYERISLSFAIRDAVSGKVMTDFDKEWLSTNSKFRLFLYGEDNQLLRHRKDFRWLDLPTTPEDHFDDLDAVRGVVGPWALKFYSSVAGTTVTLEVWPYNQNAYDEMRPWRFSIAVDRFTRPGTFVPLDIAGFQGQTGAGLCAIESGGVKRMINMIRVEGPRLCSGQFGQCSPEDCTDMAWDPAFKIVAIADRGPSGRDNYCYYHTFASDFDLSLSSLQPRAYFDPLRCSGYSTAVCGCSSFYTGLECVGVNDFKQINAVLTPDDNGFVDVFTCMMLEETFPAPDLRRSAATVPYTILIDWMPPMDENLRLSSVFSTSSVLPDGLLLNANTGRVSGEVMNLTTIDGFTFNVTASNPIGSQSLSVPFACLAQAANFTNVCTSLGFKQDWSNDVDCGAISDGSELDCQSLTTKVESVCNCPGDYSVQVSPEGQAIIDIVNDVASELVANFFCPEDPDSASVAALSTWCSDRAQRLRRNN